MTVTVKELQKRVKRGAHFLDGQTRAWALGVRLPELRMSNGAACILGQVFGDYEAQAEVFGLRKWVERRQDFNDDRSIRHGFTLAPNEIDAKQNWSRLAELWAVEVAVRQVRR